MSTPAQSRIALSIHYGHNATVGLSIDGEVVCLLSEERLNRLKNSTGFPFEALRFVRDTWLGGSFDAVDAVVLNDALLYGYEYLERRGYEAHVLQDYYCHTRKDDLDKLVKRASKGAFRRKRRKAGAYAPPPRPTEPRVDVAAALGRIAEKGGLPRDRIHLLDHHTAHAISPLYFVDDDRRYLVLTIDGEGDGICASVGIWEDGVLRPLDVTPRENSLGYLYCAVTAHLGMKPNEHEFKVMGMAPYANPEQVERVAAQLAELLWFEEGAFHSSESLMKAEDFLIRHLLYERFDTICGAVQLHTERLLLQWVSHWMEKTGLSDLLVSGGVMMNVKAVKRVSELPGITSLFVMPSSGDESLVIGGLYHANKDLLGVPPVRMTDLYLGRDFSDAEIAACLERMDAASRFTIEMHEDEGEMAEAVADALAGGLVVARCAGREEWGARALGNRSILCDAGSRANIDRINQKIKNRDFWMPFTPSVLAEDLDEYVTKPLDLFAPYMCITFDSTERARREIPAALHPRDGTVRPQELTPAYNPGYYAILQAFKKRTGVSAVLNTSFNLHGEPNVGSPEDAIRTMDNSGLDALVLGSYWLRKN